MKHVETLSASDARKELYSLVKSCELRSKMFILTSKGKAAARLLSEEDYESLMETFEVLSDKKQVERLANALKHIRQGKLHTHEEAFGRPQSKS